MRKIVVLNAGFNVVLMLASVALAQDRHFPAALGSGLPPLQQTAPRVAPPWGHHVPTRSGYGRGYGYGGYGYGGYDYGGYAPSAPEPTPVVNNIVFEPPPVILPPPEPIHSSIQNFKPAPSNEPPSFYVIALKSGAHLAAAAVWVQGNDLRYVDAEDQNRRVPLADIDRTATRELNQARNLNLRVPPPAQ